MSVVSVAVPRKGRPLEAVVERFARGAPDAVIESADDIVSTLRYEKAVTKGEAAPEGSVYERLERYSDPDSAHAPEFTLLRDSRPGMPRRIVFDSLTLPLGDHTVRLVGREEPFRALRKHEFALGFDSADLVLEEVVGLSDEPLRELSEVNDRIDPLDTDVRVVEGLDDTVHHTLLATPDTCAEGPLDRDFLRGYEGPLCISPRYERLVEAVVGTGALEGVEFVYPGDDDREEEAHIADAGAGVYLTVTGSTARDHGLVVGERLFPSETVLLENAAESGPESEAVVDALFAAPTA
ncbi:hypothetical protein [Halosegnis marinus]|uniref:ATP phosphoribosyltransferase n=1 Tax=Halosegnis marinus TaxID=3034023 RepID=A0ABD5ZS71_9EURY|nr:hypothetical protein [Halosegnis sp. DT85]